MFENAELGRQVSKAEYQKNIPSLRTQLLEAQGQLRNADFPVIILISGVDGAGKGETINLLNEWMDPRYVRTDAFDKPTKEERQRPRFWRYWRALPARGHIALYVGSWYSDPLALRVKGKISANDLDSELLRINIFEQELVDDGALIIKIWLHLSKENQAQRLQKLEEDPATRWRVTRKDHKHLKLYDQFRPIAEHALRITSTTASPWHIVEAKDARYRNLTTAQIILEQIQQRLTRDPEKIAQPANDNLLPSTPKCTQTITLLNNLDLSLSLDKATYKQQLERQQGRLNQLYRAALSKGVSSIVVLEGWDAAGKGGVIRRMVPAMDARHYHIIPVAAPTDEEHAHHYLWRFWRHLSRAGDVTIYDRSWYGRVLVERVEGFASQAEWMRAYAEINDFEVQLVEHGIVLTKFWLHISKDEQLQRFKQRESTSFKRHKLSGEDYRNREKWQLYEQAANEMIERTSTEYAPWSLVEGNDKRYARIKVLQIFCERLEAFLDNA
jgi:polyphosphate:AMP phosphotransferase